MGIHKTIEERLEQIEKDISQIKMMISLLSNNDSTQPKQEPFLNVKDVSSFLKIDSNIIYTACNKGEIPFVKIGKSYKFKKEDILNWIEVGKDKKMTNIDEYVNTYLQKNRLRG